MLIVTENVLSVDDQVCILSIGQTSDCLTTGKQVPIGYSRNLSVCFVQVYLVLFGRRTNFQVKAGVSCSEFSLWMHLLTKHLYPCYIFQLQRWWPQLCTRQQLYYHLVPLYALSKHNLSFGNISKVMCRELVHVILIKVTWLTLCPIMWELDREKHFAFLRKRHKTEIWTTCGCWSTSLVSC